jgi:CCR4-NOT transcriptional regulation complex NOT5 subunit
MSESDGRKAAELKEKIEKELDQLLEKLEAGTIDRNKLESGLKKVQEKLQRMPMPPFKK